MPNTIDDSGAAFPSGDNESQYPYEPGITRRDWFASQALNALIAKDAAHAAWELLQDGEPPAAMSDNQGENIVTLPPQEAVYDEPEAWEDVANAAYAIADAMLTARAAQRR